MHVDSAMDLGLLVELVNENQVSVLNQTPSLFYVFAEYVVEFKLQLAVPSLRYVVLGGEALLCSRLEKWCRYVGTSPQMVNGYGPTEATVFVSFKFLDDVKSFCSIGTSICDQYILLVDCNQSLIE